MKEKLRLRCDLNTVAIHDIDHVAELIEKFPKIMPYHRYSYLFSSYHDLVHGKIDEETFFTLGDISSTTPLFSSHAHRGGLETLFAIENNIAEDTLYIVEDSARHYYIGKKGWDAQGELGKEVMSHGSHYLVV